MATTWSRARRRRSFREPPASILACPSLPHALRLLYSLLATTPPPAARAPPQHGFLGSLFRASATCHCTVCRPGGALSPAPFPDFRAVNSGCKLCAPQTSYDSLISRKVYPASACISMGGLSLRVFVFPGLHQLVVSRSFRHRDARSYRHPTTVYFPAGIMNVSTHYCVWLQSRQGFNAGRVARTGSGGSGQLDLSPTGTPVVSLERLQQWWLERCDEFISAKFSVVIPLWCSVHGISFLEALAEITDDRLCALL